MKNAVCKIHKIGWIKCTGFFCKIPYNSNLLKVLITNNHILNEKDISKGQKIVISINDEAETKIIKIDSERITFTCKELDVTIIEIKPNLDFINYFLELDDNIYQNEQILPYYYDKHSIYTLHYPKGEKKFLYHMAYCIKLEKKSYIILVIQNKALQALLLYP